MGLPLAGLSALSAMTMLNQPAITTYAIFGSNTELKGIDTLIDENIQVEIQVWRYRPALLSNNPGKVDPLSLIASIRNSEDERIQNAIEELLGELWRDDK